MKITHMVCFGVSIFTTLCFLSCATGRPRDIEDELISALKQEKRSVQLKVDGGKELYTIDPTPKMSVNRCLIAVIKGWKGTEKFMEKEVEVCE